MYNKLVGGYMKKILFKIKKFFLILISFIFNLLFNRKNYSKNKEEIEQTKIGNKRNLSDRYNTNDKYGAKGNYTKQNNKDNEKTYPTIRVNIDKIYGIEQRIDKIILQIEKEDDIDILNNLCAELKKYQDKIEYLETKITEERTHKEEYKQFINISDSIKRKVKENIDVIEKKVYYLNEKKDNEQIKEIEDKQENIHEEQEEKNKEDSKDLEENTKDSLIKLEDLIVIKEIPEQVIKKEVPVIKNSDNEKSKNLKKSSKTKTETNKSKENGKQKDSIVKDSVIKDKKDKKNDTKEKSKDSIEKEELPSNDNIDVLAYKLQIDNIKNIIKNIDINKKQENIKKVVSNTMTALVLMASIPPVFMIKNQNAKQMASLFMLNNIVRESRNIIGNKKQKKLTYEDVVSKTKTSSAQIHINFILTDTMAQITSLKQELLNYGDSEEIRNLLSQLDELELELLEKMSQVDENTNDYTQENRRTR